MCIYELADSEIKYAFYTGKEGVDKEKNVIFLKEKANLFSDFRLRFL